METAVCRCDSAFAQRRSEGLAASPCQPLFSCRPEREPSPAGQEYAGAMGRQEADAVRVIDAASQLASKAGSVSNRPRVARLDGPIRAPVLGPGPARRRDLGRALRGAFGAHVRQPRRGHLLGHPRPRDPDRRFPDANLHRLPRLHPRLVSALAAGQPLGRPAERAARLPAVRELAPHPRRPSRHGRRSRPARHRRHPDADLR